MKTIQITVQTNYDVELTQAELDAFVNWVLTDKKRYHSQEVMESCAELVKIKDWMKDFWAVWRIKRNFWGELANFLHFDGCQSAGLYYESTGGMRAVFYKQGDTLR